MQKEKKGESGRHMGRAVHPTCSRAHALPGMAARVLGLLAGPRCQPTPGRPPGSRWGSINTIDSRPDSSIAWRSLPHRQDAIRLFGQSMRSIWISIHDLENQKNLFWPARSLDRAPIKGWTRDAAED
jgi:hypothetical protein